ncbi:2-phospho-L-lactate guanylyltransferase [Motilibacter peucedani]|uniref:Phosphoenolpyruvate guanylyltransferase n=1 Tax=Motilibacter peucedani TaxID=598650 RepID=A0A420XUU1_9ACTN|nr:2-phospho-L-lactate guanylyltransferase [Motilibacter peucedani]RKS80604.1 2-phospho-L-lactate guanylyltransferase [Motilibacter peucedani]
MARWTLLVPVKELSRAKTRLVPPPGVQRAELARAFALDTVAAAAAAELVERVVVVTDDPVLATRLPASAAVLAGGPDGLNPALLHAARELGAQPVAALTGDLPGLRSAELDTALATAAQHELGAVADAQGTGTTLLAAGHLSSFVPRFGEGSFAAHCAAGAAALPAGRSVRSDVDTADDLRSAVALGVGPHTAALLADRASA